MPKIHFKLVSVMHHFNPISLWFKVLLSVTCGFLIANLYYTQPIQNEIANTFGLPLSRSGLLVTSIQLGYCAGVLFIVSLGDMVNNKKLIPLLLGAAGISLIAAGCSQTLYMFMGSLFFIGVFSSASQVIVPMSIGLVPMNERGKMTGLMIAGGMLGIALARPTASLINGIIGWRYIYFIAAMFILSLSYILFLFTPNTNRNSNQISYFEVISSLHDLFGNTPGLKIRLLFMSLFFACFNIFWSTMPIVLKDALGFSYQDVALVSSVSVVTPIFSILVGKIIDKGWGRVILRFSCFIVAAAFVITPIVGMYVAGFVISILLLDPGVNMTNVTVQQQVLSMNQVARSRLNAIFVAAMFITGSIGSFIGPWIYHHFDWKVVCYFCIGLMVASTLISGRLIKVYDLNKV